MAAKPYHAGHDALIRKAAEECEEVRVFVSVKDRARKGELTISGAKMQDAWIKLIEPTLPHNVIVSYVDNPVRSSYEFVQKLDADDSQEVRVAIYGDPDDVATNYPDKNLTKYFPRLSAACSVSRVTVERTSTVDVSGTMMRSWIAAGDFANFAQRVPAAIDPKIYWTLLT